MANIRGTAGPDLLDGTDGDDVVRGLEGKDVLNGLLGNDTLDGSAGADAMHGGDGDDLYIIDSTLDAAAEGDIGNGQAGSNYDTARISVNWTLSDGIERLQMAGNTELDGIGNALDNVLIGNVANNLLRGLSGNDVIKGGGGQDTLFGGDGDDILHGNAGSGATMYGGLGDDIYYVNGRRDVVSERAGDGVDTVITAGDFLFSNEQVVLGVGVENLLLTGVADVNANGSRDSNRIVGNAGDNILRGFGGDDILESGRGNDQLYGGIGADQLQGGAGNDYLYAASVQELAYGEIYDGGSGYDIFSFASGQFPRQADFTQTTFLDVEEFHSSAFMSLMTTHSLASFRYIGADGIQIVDGGAVDISNAETLQLYAGFRFSDFGNSIDLNGLTDPYYYTVVNGGAADDVMVGGINSAFFYGNGGDDVLRAGSGGGSLDGGFGLDKLYGGDGVDFFRLSGPADLENGEIYDGGDGFDWLTIDVDYKNYMRLDLEQVTITSIEGLRTNLGELQLTAAALSTFERIDSYDVRVLDGGLVDLSNRERLDITGTLYLSDFGNTVDLSNSNSAQNHPPVMVNVWGGRRDDVFIGSSKTDYFFGGDGDDVFVGGAAWDSLQGDAGADRFVFSAGSDVDSIQDFQPGTDRVDISAFGYHSLDDMFAAGGSITAIDVFGTALVRFNSDGDGVHLGTFYPENVTADFFLFA